MIAAAVSASLRDKSESQEVNGSSNGSYLVEGSAARPTVHGHAIEGSLIPRTP